jgi:hypothetical protein
MREAGDEPYRSGIEAMLGPSNYSNPKAEMTPLSNTEVTMEATKRGSKEPKAIAILR